MHAGTSNLRDKSRSWAISLRRILCCSNSPSSGRTDMSTSLLVERPQQATAGSTRDEAEQLARLNGALRHQQRRSSRSTEDRHSPSLFATLELGSRDDSQGQCKYELKAHGCFSEGWSLDSATLRSRIPRFDETEKARIAQEWLRKQHCTADWRMIQTWGLRRSGFDS